MPLHGLALVLITILAISIRCGNVGSLHDRYALDNDSYAFLRIAEADLAGRPIPDRDTMRWWPEGRDTRAHLSLHSIVISRVYQLSSRLGLRTPFRAFAIRYPVICFALSIWVLYFLLARYLSSVAGLIAAAGLSVAPATTYRSMAGFIDRDPFCLLLVLCAYAAYAGLLSERQPRARWTAAVLCGLFSALLGLAWEGVGLFTVAFAVTLAWMTMSGRVSAGLLAQHVVWCLVAIPPLLWLSHAYRDVYQPYTALALLPVPIVCLSALLAMSVSQLGQLRPSAFPLRLATPAALFPVSLAAVLLGSAAMAGALSPRARGAVAAFIDNAASTLGTSKLMRSVAELEDMFLRDWWGHYGASLILFLVGLSIVASQLAGTPRRRWMPGILAVACSTVILDSNNVALLAQPWRGSIFGPPDGGPLAGAIRLSALPLWFLGTALLSRQTSHEAKRGGSPEQPVLFLIATWWLLLLAATAGAQRYEFFLAPAGWAAAGYGLSHVCGCEAMRDRREGSRPRVQEVVAILLIIGWSLWMIGLGPIRTLLRVTAAPALELAVLAVISTAALTYVLQPIPTPVVPIVHPWIFQGRRAAAFGLLGLLLIVNTVYARGHVTATEPQDGWLFPVLEQLDRRLPKRAVVLAWWEYGSFINALARRATVIDEDHIRPARIAEVARRVYCADDPAHAAEFLVRNGITHWLIADQDMDFLPYITSLAVDAEPAPEMRLFTVRQSNETRSLSGGGLSLPLSKPYRIQDELTLQGLGNAMNPVSISSIQLRFLPERGGDASGPSPDVHVSLSIGNVEHWMRPEILLFEGRVIHSHGPALSGAVVVDRDPATGGLRATYVPKGATRCLAVRLFLLNERVPAFRPVEGIERPSAQDGEPPHVVRVWEVRYPHGERSTSDPTVGDDERHGMGSSRPAAALRDHAGLQRARYDPGDPAEGARAERRSRIDRGR